MSKDQNPSDKACDAYFDNPYAATSGSYYSDRVTFYAGFAAGAASRDAELSECRNKAIEDCARMAAQGEWKLTIPGKSICAAIRAMKDAK